MPRPFATSPEFRRLLEGDPGVSLPRVALEIAADACPEVDVDACLDRIDDLSDRVRSRCQADARPRAVLGQVNWVLYVEEGFRGNEDDYFDPRNSYLHEVLDRKLGIPISLSILYAAVAAPLGLDLGGLSLPAHYMLRHDGADSTLYVDPFHGGALLDRQGCERTIARALGHRVKLSDDQLVPAGPTTTVARMLHNLKAIHLRSDDYASALPVARRLAALVPADLEEVRDWGLIALRSGHPGEAVSPLGRYAEARPDATDAEMVSEAVRMARREVASRN